MDGLVDDATSYCSLDVASCDSRDPVVQYVRVLFFLFRVDSEKRRVSGVKEVQRDGSQLCGNEGTARLSKSEQI